MALAEGALAGQSGLAMRHASGWSKIASAAVMQWSVVSKNDCKNAGEARNDEMDGDGDVGEAVVREGHVDADQRVRRNRDAEDGDDERAAQASAAWCRSGWSTEVTVAVDSVMLVFMMQRSRRDPSATTSESG